MNGAVESSTQQIAQRKRPVSSHEDSESEEEIPQIPKRLKNEENQVKREAEAEEASGSSRPGNEEPDNNPDPVESESEEEDEAVVAGFEYCQQEAIRYLLEEEKLEESHPLVQQLRQHLSTQRRSLDSRQVLDEFVEREDVL